MNTVGITAFSILMFSVSILYFFLFSRNQERFMQFWGFSWVAYALSLFFLQLYFLTGNEIFLEIRKITDMINLLLLLFGTYAFMHHRIPTYWYRFSLYLLLLAGICIAYRFELLSFYLPISVYQLVLTAFICVNVYQKWSLGSMERLIVAAIFAFWGIGKAVLSIGEVFADINSNYILIEILLSNVVNFCILTIYVSYAKTQITTQDDMYKTIVENSHDATFCYTFKPDPAFSYVSPSIKDLTGYAENDFYMDPRLMHKIVAESFAGDITDIFEGRAEHNEFPVMELHRKNGELFWCQFQSSFVRDESGEPVVLVGTMRDVTNLKSAEVEQVMETRRRNVLLSYISHELRTPITSIAGYLTAIQDGTMSSEEEKQEALDIISSRALTLKKLIDDLDQLSKFEANQVTFDFEAYTASDVAETLIQRNVPYAQREGFLVDVDADLKELGKHWIVIDLERINQVVANLISNAIKYSDGTKHLQITFKTDERKEHFMAFVKDEGIGIKGDQLAHIFDRFYRVGYNKNTDTSGHGLGLTLSKEIIEAHQGEIYAESEYGSGSTFSFTIPLYKED